MYSISTTRICRLHAHSKHTQESNKGFRSRQQVYFQIINLENAGLNVAVRTLLQNWQPELLLYIVYSLNCMFVQLEKLATLSCALYAHVLYHIWILPHEFMHVMMLSNQHTARKKASALSTAFWHHAGCHCHTRLSWDWRPEVESGRIPEVKFCLQNIARIHIQCSCAINTMSKQRKSFCIIVTDDWIAAQTYLGLAMNFIHAELVVRQCHRIRSKVTWNEWVNCDVTGQMVLACLP